MSTSQRDVLGMLGRLQRMARHFGIIEEDDFLVLHNGSKSSGVSFQIHNSNTNTMPFGTFHFGFTKQDCYGRMHAMSVALEIAEYNE